MRQARPAVPMRMIGGDTSGCQLICDGQHLGCALAATGVGSRTGRFLGTVLVRVGLGETGLQVTDDRAELA
jgi:hypothetical protein